MVATSGKGWHLAPALVTLVREIDARWPSRSKVSDGSIGDKAHRSRKSDHNPDTSGTVLAVDITEDHARGPDLTAFANSLIYRRDPRVNYMIYEGHICKSYGSKPWTWVPYDGENAHRQHLHISLRSAEKNNTSSWSYTPIAKPAHEAGDGVQLNVAVLRRGSKGGQVKALQALLKGKAGQKVTLDGDFGPATEAAVKRVQRYFKLADDGIVGQNTWGVMFL